MLAIIISSKSKTKSFLIWQKNDNLNLNFGDDDLKDALAVGDDDPDGIQIHEHYDNLSIKLWSDFCICSILQSREIPKHTIMVFKFSNS